MIDPEGEDIRREKRRAVVRRDIERRRLAALHRRWHRCFWTRPWGHVWDAKGICQACGKDAGW